VICCLRGLCLRRKREKIRRQCTELQCRAWTEISTLKAGGSEANVDRISGALLEVAMPAVLRSSPLHARLEESGKL